MPCSAAGDSGLWGTGLTGQGALCKMPARQGFRVQCQPRRHSGLQCQGKGFWGAVPAGTVHCACSTSQAGALGTLSAAQERRQKQRTDPSHSPKVLGHLSAHRAPTLQSPWDGDLKPPGCPTARSSIPQPRVTCTGGRSRGAGPGQRSLVLPDPPSPAAKHRLLSSPSRSRPPQHRLFLCQRLTPRGCPGRAGLPGGIFGDLCWPWITRASDGHRWLGS